MICSSTASRITLIRWSWCLLPALLLAGIARADDQADVRAVMDRMTAAVLAGDKAAYLACVDDQDPEFRTEQVNWAADFDRHKVAAFEMAWAEPGLQVSDERAYGELNLSWTMADENRKPRSVSFPAGFIKRDGAWRFTGERWGVVEVPGIRVCFAKGLDEVAARVAQVLPAVRRHVHEGFELTIDRVQVVKLYASMRHLQESIYLSYTDGLSGWNEPGEAVKVYPSRRASERELRILLAHEYGHVCTFELGPKASAMPWWVLEGVAELSAEEYQGKGFNRAVARWAESDTLADWSRLADFHTCKDEDQIYVYQQGHHMVAYVSERFGRAARNAWLREMAQGATLDDATRQTLGLDFSALDLQWRQAIKDAAASRGTPETSPPAAVPSGS